MDAGYDWGVAVVFATAGAYVVVVAAGKFSSLEDGGVIWRVLRWKVREQ